MTSYIGVPPFSQTVRTTTSLTAANNQTTFYPTGGYIVGYLDVSINGVKLIEGSDYSAGDGVSVVLTTGTSNNDVIDFTAYGAISFADSVKRSGDTITGTILVQDLIPTSNNTYSLGNTTNRFANIYLSGNTILLGDATISSNTTHVSFVMANGDPMPLAANLNASLPDTGVVANTYGNSTSIPIITVDSQGRVTNASTSSVSGVTGLTYTSANNTLTVSTSISNYDASIQAGLDEAYTNAVSTANTLAFNFAANAYANVFNGGTFTGDTTFTANITGNNISLNGSLQIDGDLTISGNTTTVSAATLTVTDNMIYMNQGISATITNIVGDGANVVFTANNNYANGWDVTVTGVDPSSYNGTYLNILEANTTHFIVANTNTDSYVSGGTARGKTDANPDIGFAAGYNDGTYHHTGLFRDATDGRWKFYHEYLPEPDDSIYIDTANASFTLANVQANYFIGTLSGDASSVGGNTAATLLGAASTAYSNALSVAASTYLPLSGGTASGAINAPNFSSSSSSYNNPNLLVGRSGDNNWSFGVSSNDSSLFFMQTKFYGNATNDRGYRVFDVNSNTTVFSTNDLRTAVGTTSSRYYIKISSSVWPEIRYTTPTYDEVIRLGVAAADEPLYSINNGDWYVYSASTSVMPFIVRRGEDSIAFRKYRHPDGNGNSNYIYFGDAVRMSTAIASSGNYGTYTIWTWRQDTNTWGKVLETYGSDPGIRFYKSLAAEFISWPNIGTSNTNYHFGNAWFRYTVTAQAYVTTSDYRLKDNIANLGSYYDKIKNLRPVEFTWKEDNNYTLGFIAHEVQEIIPEVVKGKKDAVERIGNICDESGEVLHSNVPESEFKTDMPGQSFVPTDESITAQTIETLPLVAVLTKALQEAISKVEQLEQRVSQLENK